MSRCSWCGCTYGCVYTHIHIYIHTYIYIHVCIHISIYTCLEFNVTMLMERIPGSLRQENKFNEGRLRIRYPFHAAIVTCNYCNKSWTRTPWCEIFSFFFFTQHFFPPTRRSSRVATATSHGNTRHGE